MTIILLQNVGGLGRKFQILQVHDSLAFPVLLEGKAMILSPRVRRALRHVLRVP